jgi:hypothetical protein
MATIKIKGFEGEPGDLHDFFLKSGIDLNDYLEVNPKRKVKFIWFITAGLAFFIVSLFLWSMVSPAWVNKIFTLFLFINLGIIVCICHHNWGNYFISGFVCVILLFVILISLNVITPIQAAKALQENAKSLIKKE